MLATIDAPWLSDADRERYEWHRNDLRRRVHWEAARGLELSDEMIDTTTAYAALLVAGYEPREAPLHLVAAVVFRDGTYLDQGQRPGPVRGSIDASPRRLAGQSGHGRGPVVLDWRTIRRDVVAPHRGTNVIVHEFAHKLDQLTGFADGMPPLPSRTARDAWAQTLGTNFRRLRRRGSDGLVRMYGATSPAEYFAVTSEVFFSRPDDLHDRLPRVYDRLAEFYRQDPALR
ncbi:MAG: zinc-dependent peptidase [Ilumatobacter sp.]|nr:zinc-dependent peptidase [Ilumatobacter sp.]